MSGREERLSLAYRRLLDKIAHLEQSLVYLKDDAVTLGMLLQEALSQKGGEERRATSKSSTT